MTVTLVADQSYQRDFLSAAELIERTGHARGHEARNAMGDPVSYDSPDACSFCAMGAIFRVTGSRNGRAGIMIDFLRRHLITRRSSYMVGAYLAEASDRMPTPTLVNALKSAAAAWPS
jgi:hypothetical protein